MLTPSFFEHATLEEACSLVAPEQNANYLNFLNSNDFSSCPRPPCLFIPIISLNPVFVEADLRFVLPSPRLAAVVNKLFLCCQPESQHTLAYTSTEHSVHLRKGTWFTNSNRN